MTYTLRIRQTVEVDVEVAEATSPEEAKRIVEQPEELQNVPFKDGEVVEGSTVVYSWQEGDGPITPY